jgi:hypothetical protein
MNGLEQDGKSALQKLPGNRKALLIWPPSVLTVDSRMLQNSAGARPPEN